MTNPFGYIPKPVNASDLHCDVIDMQPLQSPPQQIVGRIYYNAADQALVSLVSDNVSLQLGYESAVQVYNSSGVDLVNGAVVCLDSAINDKPGVKKAIATSPMTARIAGMCTEPIATGASGIITYRGLVHDLDTAAYPVGTSLYVHPTVAGTMTDIEPEYPYYPFCVGRVVKQHATEGIVFVNPAPDTPYSTFSLSTFYADSQNIAVTSVPQAITFAAHDFASSRTIVEHTPGSGNIKFLAAGLYQVVGRFQTYRTVSTGTATMQLYIRQGNALPLTRANDIANSSIQHVIDIDTDKKGHVLVTLLDIAAGDYINFMMIASYSAGLVGIQTTTGIVETGPYPTPSARAAMININKLR